MHVDPDELLSKIKELYPEIGRYSVDTTVHFDDLKKAWIVKMAKGENELITHLEPQDVEDCLKGVKCVYLGHQIGQFVKVYCARGNACDV